MTIKQRVREILDRLPDDCSLDDVLYEVYVVQRIERGLAEAEVGKIVSHEEVAEDLRRRWNTLKVREHDGRMEIEPTATPMSLVERGETVVAVPAEELPPLTSEIVRETVENTRR